MEKRNSFISLIFILFLSCCIPSLFAQTTSPHFLFSDVCLQKRPGFLRMTFDNVSMPDHIENVGLLGLTYYADFTRQMYGGIGGFGALTGTQGGLFVVGFGGGWHEELFPHVWGDVGLFLGGGGGRSSLVGGGLMVRPHVGIAYEWQRLRFAVNYSAINFPSGKIHSKQIGVGLDVPFDFYYIRFQDLHPSHCLFRFADVHLCQGDWLAYDKNDFAIVLQAYIQNANTHNVQGDIQNGTIKLVGAELDHYFREQLFWFIKTSGAFAGVPNGYMDVLGGIGYHFALCPAGIALVPQLGAGAGGGGMVDTGGGVLVFSQLGLEVPLTSHISTRFSGGYLYSPKGQMRAVTATGYLIYHLDLATAAHKGANCFAQCFEGQGWRIHLFNQTYVHPQRTGLTTTSAINLVGLQIDQIFSPYFFMAYQAAFAYQGEHAGGYATGMIGPGVETPLLFCNRLQLFGEVLIGAGGGGNLAIGGGALIEPVIGLHYAMTDAIGLTASVAELKSIQHELNTPVLNVGITVKFGTLNRM